MLLTMADIARRLGVSQKIAREIAQTLPGIKVGRRIRYSEEAVTAFVKSGSSEHARPENQAA